MKLNKNEFLFVNSKLREAMQYIEIQKLRKLSSLPLEKIILEIGCGRGVGTGLIQKYFSPREIYGIDLDEKMIELAKQRNLQVHYEIGNVSALRFEDEYFDAVFDFSILHHVPDWRKALQEIKRVIKTGGELIVEDFSLDSFETALGKLYRKLSKHPYSSMYRKEEFFDYLKSLDFSITGQGACYPPFLLKDFVVVARKN